MEFILLWLFFGIIGLVIANSKGRSGCLWFLIGALFGPFSIIVAFLPSVEKEREQQAQRTGQADGFKKCPFCAEVIRAEAIKCRHCGSDLSSPSSSA